MRSDVSTSRREVSRGDANGQRLGGGEGPTNVKSGVAIAVGASAILHVCVFVALDWVQPPEKKKRKPVVVSIAEPKVAAVTPDVVPMDVELFEVPAAPTAGAAATKSGGIERASRIDRSSTPTSTSTTPGGDAEVGGEPEGGGEGAVGPMAMRRQAVDLGTGGVVLHEDPEAHKAEAPIEPSGGLNANGGGTYRKRRPGFTGYVDRDGKVSFRDKKAFSAEWRIPNPFRVAKAAARGLEEWQRDPWRDVKDAERDWTSGLEVKDYTKPIDQDDSAEHGDATIPILGGSTEITDYVMRKLGQDPYQSDKLLWMDQTRDERAQIGRVHREKQLKRADEIMRRHLDRLWARTDMGMEEKREALFELWDDGAEDGDTMVVEAADRARALVIGFVRAKLPAGSAGAFTAAELDRLNRRRTSRARFAPYE
jgi:hypothetical protein